MNKRDKNEGDETETEKINDGIKEHHGGMKSKMIVTVTDYNN